MTSSFYSVGPPERRRPMPLEHWDQSTQAMTAPVIGEESTYGSDEVAKLRVKLAEAERRQADAMTVAGFVDGNEAVAVRIYEEVGRRRARNVQGISGDPTDYRPPNPYYIEGDQPYKERRLKARHVLGGIASLGLAGVFIYTAWEVAHPRPLQGDLDPLHSGSRVVASSSVTPNVVHHGKPKATALPTDGLVTSLPTMTPSANPTPTNEVSVSPSPTETVTPISQPTPTTTSGTHHGDQHHHSHKHKHKQPVHHHRHNHMVPDQPVSPRLATYVVAMTTQDGGQER